MTFEINYIEDMRTMLITLKADFLPATETEQMEDRAYEIMQIQAITHMFFLVDFRAVDFDMTELITVANVARRRAKRLPELHKAIELDIVITSSYSIGLAAKGMNTATFGYMPVRVFSKVDEAMLFIQSQL